MTSRIRISPEQLQLLILAASELADLYELDLVPWADKAPQHGATRMDGDPLWTARATQWREPEEGENPDFKVKVADVEPGYPRSTGARMNEIRQLNKTYSARLDDMAKRAARRKK